MYILYLIQFFNIYFAKPRRLDVTKLHEAARNSKIFMPLAAHLQSSRDIRNKNTFLRF